MMEALTDRWTDSQNFGRYKTITSPLFVAGHKNIQRYKCMAVSNR